VALKLEDAPLLISLEVSRVTAVQIKFRSGVGTLLHFPGAKLLLLPEGVLYPAQNWMSVVKGGFTEHSTTHAGRQVKRLYHFW
jgi:hypothetical protein